MKRAVVGLWIGSLLAAGSWGAEVLRREIPWRFAPAELIKRTIQPQLSPEGRFVILREKGTVLVIDEPDRVMAAAEAMEKAEVPPPRIQLSLGLETGGRVREARTSTMGGEQGPLREEGFVPFPSSYLAPRVARVGGRGVVVLPAHPTGFRKRAVGQRMEVTPQVEADGSIALDVNAEQVEFSGFISYGSPIVAPGMTAEFPVASNLPGTAAFQPYLGGEGKVPLLETTRISSSVLIRPELEANQVIIHLVPQLLLENGPPGETGVRQPVLLRDLASQAMIPPGKAVRLPGFATAPAEFNTLFFAPREGGEGLTRLVLKAEVRPAE